ncbi:MAG: hypothetical protein AAF138_04550 [Planctomycetota bacterium]
MKPRTRAVLIYFAVIWSPFLLLLAVRSWIAGPMPTWSANAVVVYMVTVSLATLVYLICWYQEHLLTTSASQVAIAVPPMRASDRCLLHDLISEGGDEPYQALSMPIRTVASVKMWRAFASDMAWADRNGFSWTGAHFAEIPGVGQFLVGMWLSEDSSTWMRRIVWPPLKELSFGTSFSDGGLPSLETKAGRSHGETGRELPGLFQQVVSHDLQDDLLCKHREGEAFLAHRFELRPTPVDPRELPYQRLRIFLLEFRYLVELRPWALQILSEAIRRPRWKGAPVSDRYAELDPTCLGAQVAEVWDRHVDKIRVE